MDVGGTFVQALDTYNPPDAKTNRLDESEEQTNGEAVSPSATIIHQCIGTRVYSVSLSLSPTA